MTDKSWIVNVVFWIWICVIIICAGHLERVCLSNPRSFQELKYNIWGEIHIYFKDCIIGQEMLSSGAKPAEKFKVSLSTLQ